SCDRRAGTPKRRHAHRARRRRPRSRRRVRAGPDSLTTRAQRHPVAMTLFWRVFTINADMLLLATLALALSPTTVSADLHVIETLVLSAKVLVLVALNVMLLQRTFTPLERLTALMRHVDPMLPKQHLPDKSAGAKMQQLS